MTAAAEPGPVREETGPALDLASQEEKRMAVQTLVEQLVSRTFRKVKIDWSVRDPEAITKRLFERTWAEVDGVDFDATSKTWNKLDKVILQDLCKRRGNAEMVLVFMSTADPEFDTCLASLVKDHLTKPKKISFLSRVRKAISSMFCRGKVGVV